MSLVLDISLPGLNGLELQKRVAIERTDMPIIFITGHGDIPMSVEAMKAGAVEFLTKPFNDEVLLTAVRQALERSRVLLRSRLNHYHRLTSRKGDSVTDKNNTLHIDIPVVLDQVKAVFSVASLSFEKDLPAALFHMGLIVNDSADWKAKTDIVAVFHTNAGHVTLHDDAYNKERNISTGNPYKRLVTDLMEKGVRVELCGATAKAYGWVNADTIPGIKINTDAMSRLIQLVQEGFVKISES